MIGAHEFLTERVQVFFRINFVSPAPGAEGDGHRHAHPVLVGIAADVVEAPLGLEIEIDDVPAGHASG